MTTKPPAGADSQGRVPRSPLGGTSTADNRESSPTPIEPATDPQITRNSSTHSDLKGSVSPRLPFEHDESSSSAGEVPDPMIEQAARDLQQGRMQTDRGEVTDEVYARTLRDSGRRSDTAERDHPHGDIDRR